MIIYKIENKINGHVYIGQTQRKLEYRVNYHSCSNKFPIGRAFKKYGADAFIIAVIDHASSKDELDEKENYWIKFYNCKVPNGYNLTDGGEGRYGFKVSDETKKKISKSHIGIGKGIKQSPEMIQKRADAVRGRKNSPETIEKMKQSAKGRVISEETKEKMRVSAKARGVAPELIEKLKRSRIGRKNKPESITKRMATIALNAEKGKNDRAGDNQPRQ